MALEAVRGGSLFLLVQAGARTAHRLQTDVRTANPLTQALGFRLMLTSFWFNTNKGLGFSVTAESQEAAEELLRQYGYPLSASRLLG